MPPDFTPAEPTTKRAIVFVDGQNLYHCVRETFSCTHPNYDVLKLARAVCELQGWQLSEVHFYTGFPDARHEPHWNRFWSKKLLAIKRQGVHVFSRQLRYRKQVFKIAGGVSFTTEVGEEKGIDVRIAIDLIRLAYRQRYDVAVVFSQDQDLSEVADEIRVISREQRRWIKMASAFPFRPGAPNCRGINGTDWIQIDEPTYVQNRVVGGGVPYFQDMNPIPRMYAYSSFNALNDAWLRLSQNPATGDGGTCYGDSGGPNFLMVNGVRTLLAITITGDSVCRATNVVYRVDTNSARGFLAPYVALP